MRTTLHSIHTATLTTLVGVAVCLCLAACGPSSNRVRISGQLLKMNQASFYLYSPDGVIQGFDTIKANGGRFEYEREIRREGIIAVIYPNFSVIPVYVRPGDDISVKGDATALSQQRITGSDANKEFSQWRQDNAGLKGAKLRQAAEKFIEEHPASPLSAWLVSQNFLLTATPDIKTARRLLKGILAAQPDNIYARRLNALTQSEKPLKVGDKLPRFQTKDIDGKAVNDHQVNRGRTIICLWATWSNESQGMLRQLASNRRQVKHEVTPASGGKQPDHVVTICLDGSVKECRKTLKDCNAEELTTVCDTMQWSSPLVKSLDLNNVPDNLVLQDGRVAKRGVRNDELFK